MEYAFQTDQFDFQYKEDQIEHKVLWESHCHAQFEMIAVLEGDVSVMLEGRKYRLTKNQTTVIPPLFYHTITANKKGTYRRVTVLFDAGAVPDVLQPQFLSKDAELSLFFSRHADTLMSICKDERPQFYAPLAESLMIQLFYSDARAEHVRPHAEVDDSLRQILDYIDGHLCDKILLDDIAAHTARSKSSVCHLFQEKMKLSPKQYILQKKLALAAKLIRGGTPPTLAAMQVGYDNYSNFYRMYRKHFQTAPTQIKR